MVQALPMHAQMIQSSLCHIMSWWRSLFTITRLTGASTSAATRAIDNWPPTDCGRIGHCIAQFHLSSTVTSIRLDVESSSWGS